MSGNYACIMGDNALFVAGVCIQLKYGELQQASNTNSKFESYSSVYYRSVNCAVVLTLSNQAAASLAANETAAATVREMFIMNG